MNWVGQILIGVVEATATLLTGRKHRLVPATHVYDPSAEAKAAQNKKP